MKAFIRSTHMDLIAHRNAVAESLERLGHQAGKKEVFGARPEGAQEVCKKEIEECDLFIGIYAYRYGFVPPASQHSITEQEFNHARMLDKPILCFIADKDHPRPPKLIEDEPGRTKLKAFKARISNTFVIDSFTTTEDLAYKGSTSVSKYLSDYSAQLIEKEKQGVDQPRIKAVSETIDIQAPAQEVWEALTDVSLMPEWISFIATCDDSTEQETHLRFESWPFYISSYFTVLTNEPKRELCLIRYFSWLRDSDLSVRYLFQVESTDTSLARLVHRETFEGNMSDFFWLINLMGVIPQLRARWMNNKLRRLVEKTTVRSVPG